MTRRTMGKKKKKLRKKINPEKSNKMIYAVAAGLTLLIVIFLVFTISGEKVVDKKDLMAKTLKYVKKIGGVKELKTFPDEGKVIIVYDPFVLKKDFQAIAKAAGQRLSNKWGEEKVTVVLCEEEEANKVYSVALSDGRVLEEKVSKHPDQ